MTSFISFQSNRIVKLEGLDGLVNLEELYISDNGIEEIEGLDNLVSYGFFKESENGHQKTKRSKYWNSCKERFPENFWIKKK